MRNTRRRTQSFQFDQLCLLVLVTDQRALLLSAVNFDSPQSHCSVSVSDALALQRLAQRRTLAHATRLTLVRPVSGSAASALDGAPTAVLEITASLTWLLSDAFRRTFATVGEFQLRSCAPCDARSHAVAVRGARLSLHIDDDSFRALGLASRSVDLSVPGSVGAVARRTLDALPAFQSLSMLASCCVDGVQSDIAAALAALPAAEQPAGWRLVPTKRSSVRRSSVRVPKVAGDISWSSTALQLLWACLTVRGESDAVARSRDAVSLSSSTGTCESSPSCSANASAKICFALQSCRLPALLTMLIIDEACSSSSTFV